MKQNRLIIAIGILLIVIFGLWLCVYQVRKSEVAVVTTFGRLTGTETNAGPYLKWPPPIQIVHKFDQRIQNFEDKYDESLTSDGFNLLTMVYVGWQISNPAEFYPKFPNGSITEAEKNLEGLVRSAKSAVIGRHPLSDFASTDAQQLRFTEIEQEILVRVQDQVNAKNYGMRLEFLGIKKLGFPESVTQEVFKQMTSERNKLTDSIQSEGEAEAIKIRSAADSKSQEMLANANAEATRIQGEGVREASKSFAVFEEAPELASFLLKLNALEQSLKSRATLVFDQHTVPYDLFKGYTNNVAVPK